ncbi:RsbRD N-terminal domain-containing protein [Desulfarculales bacterium]
MADVEIIILALTEILSRKREALVDQWFSQVVATYPDESASFLKRKKDQFQNPVGHTLAKETDILFGELVGDMDREKILASLNRIVRIRAIQDFSPTQALGFIPSLKTLIWHELGQQIAQKGLAEEMCALEGRLDQVLLMAFDVFIEVRQRIYEMKAEEVKRLYYQVIRRADILCPIPQQEEPDLPPTK